MILAIRVHGTPAPQGSKRHVGHGVMVESSKALPTWREAVKQAALDVMRCDCSVWVQPPRGTAVELRIDFAFPRPASHYGTGRNAGTIKPSALFWKPTAPDLSKLIRATEDALTDAGVWADDAQVSRLVSSKAYAFDQEAPGAYIEIEVAS